MCKIDSFTNIVGKSKNSLVFVYMDQKIKYINNGSHFGKDDNSGADPASVRMGHVVFRDVDFMVYCFRDSVGEAFKGSPGSLQGC